MQLHNEDATDEEGIKGEDKNIDDDKVKVEEDKYKEEEAEENEEEEPDEGIKKYFEERPMTITTVIAMAMMMAMAA